MSTTPILILSSFILEDNMSQVHGMAASIRSAQESETFDLAGLSSSTIEVTMKSAFSDPFPLKEMIRLTFVTGAGKLSRQKYNDNASKALTKVLNDLGYIDDKGASCVLDSQGCYKSQHDTGKNIKTIVVFPKVYSVLHDRTDNASKEDKGPKILEEGSPGQLISICNLSDFEKLLSSKCPSWSQKKKCISVISDIRAIIESLEGKLVAGSPLTESEQEFYDSCDLSNLQMKDKMVKDEMQKCIDEGKITSIEKKKLLEQVREKLSSIANEINDFTDKPQKIQQLQEQRMRLKEREKKLESLTPCSPQVLKFQYEIETLRKELHPLLKLEHDTKGRLLTLKETTTLVRKEVIELEILGLEEKSRGWFEDDEDFQLRLDASRALSKSKADAVKKKISHERKPMSFGGVGVKNPINFVIPGSHTKRLSKSDSKANKTPTSAFAAMMLESDSDTD